MHHKTRILPVISKVMPSHIPSTDNIIGQVDQNFIACTIPVKQAENGLLETFQMYCEPTSTSPALVSFFRVSVSYFKVHTVSFCLHILMSIDSQKIRHVKCTKEHLKMKETIERMKPIMDHFVSPELAKQWQRDEMQRQKEMLLFCFACLKSEQKQVTGKMPVCTQCKIGRAHV